MLPSFAQETLRVYYPTAIARRGTTDYSFDLSSAAGTIVISGCSVQPTTTSETLTQPREQEALMMTAWIPEAQWARVIAGGETRRLVMEWRGHFFEMYGTEMPWISPSGNLDHVQVYLRLYRG